jgi:threonine/homoserine efflux transporter RhtA
MQVAVAVVAMVQSCHPIRKVQQVDQVAAVMAAMEGHLLMQQRPQLIQDQAVAAAVVADLGVVLVVRE